jgi:hypothetical protein
MRAALCSGSRQFCASNPRHLPLHLGSLVMRAALVLLANSVPALCSGSRKEWSTF